MSTDPGGVLDDSQGSARQRAAPGHLPNTNPTPEVSRLNIGCATPPGMNPHPPFYIPVFSPQILWLKFSSSPAADEKPSFLLKKSEIPCPAPGLNLSSSRFGYFAPVGD